MRFLPLTVLLMEPLIFGNATLLTSTFGKSKDLINDLKHNLRKNNDDYIEPIPSNTTSDRSSDNLTDSRRFDHKRDPVGATSKQIDLPRDIKRRSYNELASEDSHGSQQSSTPALPNSDIFTITKTTSKTATNNNATKGATLRIVNGPNFRSEKKHMHKEKMERFKKFMSRNKDAFNAYLNKKLTALTTTQRTKVTVSPRETSKENPSINAVTNILSVAVKKEMSQFDSEKEGPIMAVPTLIAAREGIDDLGARFRARIENSNREPVVPKAENLDMSPAKGRKVHVMRLKGRLCQRNVMLPEGPKYDSEGRMYLGAYVNKYGRDYSHTKRPRLLLPRCCNCRRKSVLGCE